MKGEGLHINRLSLEVGEIMIREASSLSHIPTASRRRRADLEQGVPLMDYIVGMPRQTTNFLLSLGFGFCIGVLYDVVRTIRLIFRRRKTHGADI